MQCEVSSQKSIDMARKHNCSPVLNLAPDYPIGDIDGYILSKEQKKLYNDKNGTREQQLIRKWTVYLEIQSSLGQ